MFFPPRTEPHPLDCYALSELYDSDYTALHLILLVTADSPLTFHILPMTSS
ncbi:hypothetical protein COMA2_10426 [Candidatus Nitrospira nitrificans]|uniref:Uncharacterized protein n=1 Tax=Candidatus Nitrospira nitrificans TaxID=1742973 RepID=A0A0S4L5H3_9BACT|nr:hypothetical protein COMA2_10426 [Candidatus Nitrospira nitrificans]